MTDEQEKRFHECIKSLPPRSYETPEAPKCKSAETPEMLPVLESTELKVIAKELHSISQELNTLNRILKRK